MKRLVKTVTVALIAAIGVATSTQAADRKLGVSMPILSGPWYTAILYGLQTKAKELNYEIVVLDAGGYGNVDRQITQVSNLIAQQVDAILVDPANPAAFNGVARQAQQAGIPVIGVSSPIVASDVPADGAVSSSHCNLGEHMAKGAKNLLPSGGKIGVLEGPAGAFWAAERLRCFKRDIAGSGIEIVASKATEQDMSVALTTANDFLQRFPNLDLLYGADDTYGVGAARAVQQAGKCGKTKVLMAVLGEAAQSLMEQGCVDFVVAQKPVVIGRQSVEVADGLITKKFSSGEYRQIPVVPVRPENLKSIDLTEIRQPKGWRP